jgi:hypothetical protein
MLNLRNQGAQKVLALRGVNVCQYQQVVEQRGKVRPHGPVVSIKHFDVMKDEYAIAGNGVLNT